jgi:hypothetical protein
MLSNYSQYEGLGLWTQAPDLDSNSANSKQLPLSLVVSELDAIPLYIDWCRGVSSSGSNGYRPPPRTRGFADFAVVVLATASNIEEGYSVPRKNRAYVDANRPLWILGIVLMTLIRSLSLLLRLLVSIAHNHPVFTISASSFRPLYMIEEQLATRLLQKRPHDS